MKALIFILFFFGITFTGSSQLVLSGNVASTSIANNAPAIVVDNSLAITGTGAIDAARVSISANFSVADILTYTGTLPSGVTAGFNAATGVLTFTGTATPAQYQALLRTVTFNTTASSVLQRTITFNLGSAISFSGNGHFYEFITGTFSWTAAKADAASKSFYGLQGYLTTITSQAENDFIQLKTSADGWIGASDHFSEINTATGASTYAAQINAEGKWYWVTGPASEKGTQFSNNNGTPTSVSSRYMNWNAGEPNNSSSAEHYGQIYSTSSTGKWNDLGTASLGYVVEYGGMSGDPAVTLSVSRAVVMIATSLQTTASSNNYVLHAAPAYIDNAIFVYSNGSITDAKVTIAAGFNSGDVLSYTGTRPGSVTAVYSSVTGILSFSGTATASQWQALFRTVNFTSTSNVIGDRNISFSVGNQVSGSNGHFYEYVATTGSWTTAKTSAAAKTYLGLNGYLATITSQSENDFIKQKIGTDAWIGASDEFSQINAATGASTYAAQVNSEGKWYWVTGPAGEKGIQFSNGNTTPVAVGTNYMNWNGSEPNNSSSNEHYGQLFASGANPGKWNDLPNTSALGFVVEYGGLASDPLLFLSANRTMAISSVLASTGLQFLKAVKNNNGVMLNWSTHTETNADHFSILHSTDGFNFVQLDQVAASGNSNRIMNYQWFHTAPQKGNNFYKITETGRDGRSVMSEVKQVYNGSVKITVSPNPAHAQLVITYPYTGNPATLLIRNNLGAVVLKQNITSFRTFVPVSQLPAGLYIAVLKENNVSNSLTFIKQ
ncbi:MAG: T9SS type A sorting domain-containing protein [Gemmatimonadaceae bacterium]|nr:T9SS type A sorting domain-containing protein [Chitinophagaceae bacterium]